MTTAGIFLGSQGGAPEATPAAKKSGDDPVPARKAPAEIFGSKPKTQRLPNGTAISQPALDFLHNDRLEITVQVTEDFLSGGNTISWDIALLEDGPGKDVQKRYFLKHHELELPKLSGMPGEIRQETFKLWPGPDGYEVNIGFWPGQTAANIALQIGERIQSGYTGGNKEATALARAAYARMGINTIPEHDSAHARDTASYVRFMKLRTMREIALKADTLSLSDMLQKLQILGDLKSDVEPDYGKEGVALLKKAEDAMQKALDNLAKKDYRTAAGAFGDAADALEQISALPKKPEKEPEKKMEKKPEDKPTEKMEKKDTDPPLGERNPTDDFLRLFQLQQGNGFFEPWYPLRNTQRLAEDLRFLQKELPGYGERIRKLER